MIRQQWDRLMIILTMMLSVVVPATKSHANPASSFVLAALDAQCDYSVHHQARDGMELALHHNGDVYQAEQLLFVIRDLYETIIFDYGFDRPGYTPGDGTKEYVCEKDQRLDVFVLSKADVMKDSRSAALFASMPPPPCFNILPQDNMSVDTIIVLPERVWAMLSENPSYLDGMIIHELSHAVLYHYNKNVTLWEDRDWKTAQTFGKDWYTEGLARYFEAMVGGYEYFFEAGYTYFQNGQERINQDGVNYLMRHPNEPFYRARYDFALFWAYLHERYGMKGIERVSAAFRSIRSRDVVWQAPEIMSRELDRPFESLLQDFALAMLRKDFRPHIAERLDNVRCRELIREQELTVSLEPWASDLFLFANHDLLKEYSFSIHSEQESVLSLVIRYRDDVHELLSDIRIDMDSPYHFQVSQDQIDDVQDIVLIVTNLTQQNEFRIIPSDREYSYQVVLLR